MLPSRNVLICTLDREQFPYQIPNGNVRGIIYTGYSFVIPLFLLPSKKKKKFINAIELLTVSDCANGHITLRLSHNEIYIAPTIMMLVASEECYVTSSRLRFFFYYSYYLKKRKEK